MKSICFFGIYDPKYARARVLRSAFEQNDVKVIDCNVDPKQHHGVSKYLALIRKWRAAGGQQCDQILVCYPGHSVVWLACLLARRPVLFDAFLSLYDSNVYDRRVYSKHNPRAWYDWFLDWSSTLIARKVFLDTNEHIKYFVQTFGTDMSKCVRVPIGADEGLFFPRENRSPATPFIVHFHGMFIPLQGVPHIIRAAEILKDEDIVFQIVGSGQEYRYICSMVEEKNLSKVQLIGKIPIESVPGYVAASHMCLGIFGDTQKTLRVIPNKVYEYAAMGKAIITADSPAIREVFMGGVHMLLCPAGDGEALASGIKYLYENRDKANALGKEALSTFQNKLNAKQIGSELISHLYEN